MTVRVRTEEVVIPTYLPATPAPYPMFLQMRVYQGSGGNVYPLPLTDRIAETKTPRKWKAVWLENEYLRVMLLPEIGGRIHVAQDRTNGYDFVYRQSVIKPALVGLAGPWISGGVEFNWPQHHRPATFLPVDVHVEEHSDGAKTVWLGDHDPMARMKCMHGVCLHPGKAFIELKVRAYNRTPFVQTFLWWANAATRVHEAYQSFFPPDVQYVADHARRAVSEYPLCQGLYYGVLYGERGRKGVPAHERPSSFLPPHCGGKAPVNYAPNDLSWYANIPTPCSFMCTVSKENFFGGYDHFRQAGIIHIADHHICPGKKQWTWGNHDFGYAWDRNLTDGDGPYIELMAGVYSDNQPDFSFLGPGETKAWSQYWYPIQKIGPAQHATLDAAVSLVLESGKARIGVSVSAAFPGSSVTLSEAGRQLAAFTRDLAPGSSVIETFRLPKGVVETDLLLRVTDSGGREIISYAPRPRVRREAPLPASEPPPPEAISSADELYVTGLHLEQYRHATRCPTAYWREALRRDSFDSRSNNAMGLWHLRRGELADAERHFRAAAERLALRNPNPYDGEPLYNLGLCLRHQLDALAGPAFAIPNSTETGNPETGLQSRLFERAYASFYKATWNQSWASAAHHALAELDCRRAEWRAALDHLDRSLRLNSENLRARDLKAIVLRKLGRGAEAEALLRGTFALDPLDWWARHLGGDPVRCDAQARLDIAHDFARAGFYGEAIALLKGTRFDSRDLPDQNLGAAPLVSYTLGWLHEKMGDAEAALGHYRQAASLPPDYCFPARLEEIAVLEAAMRANPGDARAPYYLGNLLYGRRRHQDAIRLWERSARIDPAYHVVWRNLGIGYFNVLEEPNKARLAYERAFRARPDDARLLYERDQLWKRLRVAPEKRLKELEKHSDVVRQRDDLSAELCALLNQTGQHQKALELSGGRTFQPWEGGEGVALGQHVRGHLGEGRIALAAGDTSKAREHFEAALTSPRNLGEAKHLLANQSDIHYWLGVACRAAGDRAAARRHWNVAASFRGDFQEMSARSFSEKTYYSALSMKRLGKRAKARSLLSELLAYAREFEKTEAKIDYFATSLPAMLLFEDDIQLRQETVALFLQAQAHLGLGRRAKAKNLLAKVLRRDPSHAMAADLKEELKLR